MTRKLKDILRCYASGMSIRSISAVFEISRNTVRGYVRQFQECGLTMEKLQSIPEHHLQEMFCSGIEHSKQPSARQKELEALLPEYAARVKRKGVTVKSLYEEYIKSHPGGYQRSAFGRYLQRYTLSTRAVGHVEHYAGDQMYIGYAGDKLEIVDAETGDVRIVDVFVAILPCSHYTYCEASWSQRKEDLIKSCENALHFFGGVPMAIVPDNLKSAADLTATRWKGLPHSTSSARGRICSSLARPGLARVSLQRLSDIRRARQTSGRSILMHRNLWGC